MGNGTDALVLIVDGSAVGPALQTELAKRWRTSLAASSESTLAAMRQPARPDLVVLGTALADATPEAVLAELRGGFLTADIPVLALADAGDPGRSRRLLRSGAADVLPMPADPELLAARAGNLIELKLLRAAHLDQDRHLDHLVSERTRELSQARDAAILAMAWLAEGEESGNVGHFRRSQKLFTALARELRFHPRFAHELSDERIALMAQAVPLHDIGKVRVPREILLKPGRLSTSEFELMKMHTVYGRDAINAVKQALGGSSPFLRYAREIAHSHQEKWDGSGYPEGLKGEAIPLSARLMAVADVYDALISERVYKLAFTHETAIELIRQGRGEHFDPDIVDALLAIEDRFKAIAAEFAEG